MGQFQVPPIKQLPTQIKRMQRQLNQLHMYSSANFTSGISWTLAAYAGTWGPSSAGQDLFYEFTPDGNFVYMSGSLTIPVGATSPSTIATLAPECAPFRLQSMTAFSDNGSGTLTPLLIKIDTSANVIAYGTLTAGNTVWINGYYPIAAKPAL